jgi:ribonucleoside-triphosphate reductase
MHRDVFFFVFVCGGLIQCHVFRVSKCDILPCFSWYQAGGGNPCLEQTLESFELCCLVETFPFRHTEQSDYEDTLRSAMLYAKTVTLGRTHWPKSNRVMMRNRRIGCSISGVSQFVAERGLDNLKDWLESGYDVVQDQDEVGL